MPDVLAVEVGHGQRDALAALVLHHDDELAGLGRAGELGVLDLEQVGDVREVPAGHDLVATGLCISSH